MADKLYKRVCTNCDCVFEHPKRQKQLCPDCDKIRHREASRKSMRKKRSKYKPLAISLNRLVYLLEKYNSSHGTSYTYGQFEQLMSSGHIDIREVVN